MGDNGNRPMVNLKDKPWYQDHPSCPSAGAVPILTIIFWASEGGSLFRAIGWLKDAIPGGLQLQELNQAVHQHVENILAEMIRSGLIHAEEGTFSLVKGESGEARR